MSAESELVLPADAGRITFPEDMEARLRDRLRLERLRTARLSLARRLALGLALVGEIGPIDGLQPLPAALLDRIGHKPPPTIPRRSKAWLAQRRLVVAR